MVIKLETIGLKFGKNEVLHNVSLELQRGKITTLIGPNGGGKTSLARIIIGVLKADVGKIFKENNLKIGYMPQRITLDSTIPLRVIDFLKLTTHKIDAQNSKNFIAKFSKIANFNLEKIFDKQVTELSGGQLQKLLFLRAIINNPDLLVLDEPTQCMDVKASEEFYHIIDEIRNRNNCAILLISHDLHIVMKKTDFVFCINNHICCHGAPESVNEHPEYLALFGNRIDGLAVYQHRHDHKH